MEQNPAVYAGKQAKRNVIHRCDRRPGKRVWEHKQDLVEGFTRKYGVHMLVYFEMHCEMLEAIQREKQLKKWNRAWKIELIEETNPLWRDLWQDIVERLNSIGCSWIQAFAEMTIDGKAAPQR